jgi:cyclase
MITSDVGAQSVAVCLDVKKDNIDYSIFTHRGTKKVKLGLLEALELLENNSFGEVIINSIDRDGTYSGYDMELARIVRENTSVNITILGGCNALANIVDLEKEIGVCGCAAGSFYTFVGKNNAVLLNYNKPTL